MPYQDGLLDFTAPADATYWLRLNQFTYTAGGTDFFYRLNVGTGPWIDAIHPPMVPAGKATPVTVYGRNLPGGVKDPTAVVDGVVLEKVNVTVNAPADPQKFDFFGNITPWQASLNGFEYRLGASNPKFLEFSQVPIVLENDDNDTPDKAQKVTVPCEIAGRIDKRARPRLVLLRSQEGGRPPHRRRQRPASAPRPTSTSSSSTPANKQAMIVLQDDTLETVTPQPSTPPRRDPAPYRFVVPKDGTYQLAQVGSHVGDIMFGPHHNYRVPIAPEAPDFRLVVMPPEDFRSDAFVIGKSGQQFLNIYAIRQDGFKGEIEIAVQGLPKGLTAAPQVVGGSDKHGMLVIRAGDDAPEKYEGPILRDRHDHDRPRRKVTHECPPRSVPPLGHPESAEQSSPERSPASTAAATVALRGKARSTSPRPDKVLVMIGDKIDIPLKMVRHDPEFKGNFQVTPVQTELRSASTSAR